MKKFSGPIVPQFFFGSEPQRYVIAHLLLTGWRRYLMYQQHMTGITSPQLTIQPMMAQEAMKLNRWTAVLDGSTVLPFYSYQKVTGQVRTSWKHETQTFSSFMRCKPICTQQFNVPSTLHASAIGIVWLELQHTASSSSTAWKNRAVAYRSHITHWLTSTSSALLKVRTFGSEILSLQKGKEILSSSPLKTLCPFVNGKNELRAKGRLSKAKVLETARHPLILDGVNPIVKLLIKNTHVVNSHSGVEQTRSFLMEYYWILKCRAVVRQTIRQCIPCRRMAQEISPPQMSDLPSERLPLQNHFAFATTGLDFIGPFPIKQCGKFATRYVLLFSCLVVRAVHLEVSESLSTGSTMSCIRRFISRRGKPKIFYSDNGKSFVGSCSELRKGIEALRSSQEFASKLHILDVDINGKFNPPSGSAFWRQLGKISSSFQTLPLQSHWLKNANRRNAVDIHLWNWVQHEFATIEECF